MRFDQPPLARTPHDSVIERAAEKFRENRDEIEPHRQQSYPN
jgi:hypothetical protein